MSLGLGIGIFLTRAGGGSSPPAEESFVELEHPSLPAATIYISGGATTYVSVLWDWGDPEPQTQLSNGTIKLFSRAAGGSAGTARTWRVYASDASGNPSGSLIRFSHALFGADIADSAALGNVVEFFYRGRGTGVSTYTLPVSLGAALVDYTVQLCDYDGSITGLGSAGLLEIYFYDINASSIAHTSNLNLKKVLIVSCASLTSYTIANSTNCSQMELGDCDALTSLLATGVDLSWGSYYKKQQKHKGEGSGITGSTISGANIDLFFESLASTSLGVLDVANNTGSGSCDPDKAIIKGYYVFTSKPQPIP